MHIGTLAYPEQKKAIKSTPRGLVWDIETSPLIAYTWGMYEDSVIEVIEDYQILSVAWQWVGEKRVHVRGQDDFDDYIPGINNDKSIVTFIRDLLDECDFEVAHNGDQFDVKKVNARMIIHGLTPPSPYKQIDTKKIAKRVGNFTSNRLKHLADQLQVNQKGDPGGFGTWKGCLAGDPKAWKQMKKYNKQDIPPLMDLYMKFRPWDTQAYPMNIALELPDGCHSCGSLNLIKQGIRRSKTNSYQQYRCLDCGSWSRARVADKRTPEERMQYV